MLNNFHGMVFGYKVNSAVYDKLHDKCSDEEYDILLDHTWQIDDDTLIISCEILVHDENDENALYGLTEINQLLAEKKNKIDNFMKYAEKLLSVLDDSITLLPQLYYINVTM